ncbi:MAG TPA: oxygen-independent coproporphyrinogen III oxidase [Candidatus Babeliaceae bacterium]|nr:oxygen-independent coproporphyrinogen III oxidase [Candidatus Babeliaceae bacterium]
MTPEALLCKYDHEVPRYTSYPTVPFWKEMDESGRYVHDFEANFAASNDAQGISLYIHLPFCESLCTYCGCTKIITTNHRVEDEYLNAVIGEWYQYRKLMPETPVIRELHLGGGTPTFFSPESLKRLLNCIFDLADIHPEREFSIEGHPNNTNKAHLETLYRLGFRRLSLGVQDHNPDVQRIINRIQPYEHVKRVTEMARQAGFNSVNYDLIYGLPLQTVESVRKTAEDTIFLRPDRIAYYSYAHIPWKMKSQRLYDERFLPPGDLKMKFYLLSRSLFLAAGYADIGMDHFALPGDSLFKAFEQGDLHRNFMGYTTSHTRFMIGLGVSAISDIGSAYAQNRRELTSYYHKVKRPELPLGRGYFLNDEDIQCREYIMSIACKGETTLDPHSELLNTYVLPELQDMTNDGLIELSGNRLSVTQPGRLFIRNICRSFDVKWKRAQLKNGKIRFSKSV